MGVLYLSPEVVIDAKRKRRLETPGASHALATEILPSRNYAMPHCP